jgi:hypothetical protein
LTRNETDRATWLKRVEQHNLRLLADLHSELHGDSEVTATSPHLAGTISGLERGQSIGGPTLTALVERLAPLFDDDPVELRRSHLALAPVETPVDLDRLAIAYREMPLLVVFQPMVGQVVIHSHRPDIAVGDLFG